MITSLRKNHDTFFYRIFSAFIVFTFIFSLVLPPGYAQLIPASPAGGPQTLLNLPAPGTMVTPTAAFTPTLIKGLTIHPENPLEFDFIVEKGQNPLQGEEFNKESMRLVKYFLASLTVPEDQMWVNLSPYENNRIISENLGATNMGKDMLAQDYILKQLTASLMYPENELGKKFWDKIYKKAYEQYGTTEIPIDTFNKVWIMPDKAVVYEHEGSVFVIGSHLRVMLEEDYLATQHESSVMSLQPSVSSTIIKEIILPEIEREVNTGETFANLRQIYNSMILATWYKKNLRESLLGQVYVDRNKIKGVDLKDPAANQKIYEQYLEAFRKGVYNYIKEDVDPVTKEITPRKYFSGGAVGLKESNLTTLYSLPQKQQTEIVKAFREIGNSPDSRFSSLKIRLYEIAQANRISEEVMTEIVQGIENTTADEAQELFVGPTASSPVRIIMDSPRRLRQDEKDDIDANRVLLDNLWEVLGQLDTLLMRLSNDITQNNSSKLRNLLAAIQDDYQFVERAVERRERDVSSPVTVFDDALEASYTSKVTDEYVKPVVLTDAGGNPIGALKKGDVWISLNFRRDRTTQLTEALLAGENFKPFPAENLDLMVVEMKEDENGLIPPGQLVLAPVYVPQTVGEYFSQIGLKQFRTAETEKFRHVTRFFNGAYSTKPFAGEDRLLVPSPRDVVTYDQKPEMSAYQVTAGLIERLQANEHDFYLLNYANPDMVGHTGNLEATVQTIGHVDKNLQQLLPIAQKQGLNILITADHGNADEMLDKEGKPQTKHSLNPVPLIFVPSRNARLTGTPAILPGGGLADVAPTLLHTMGLEQPTGMTGRNLLEGYTFDKGQKTLLIVLDGFAINPNRKDPGDAIRLAGERGLTPTLDKLFRENLNTLLDASGEAVGLPKGQMGSSETGHMVMGAGRVIKDQPLVKINEMIAKGRHDQESFFKNPALLKAMHYARDNRKALHIEGLLSDGGVHSMNTHWYALLEMAEAEGVREVYLHPVLDGRDVGPQTAQRYLEELQGKIDEIGSGHIVTMMGRFYAMDRDYKWDRTKIAYDAYVHGQGERVTVSSPAADRSNLRRAYEVLDPLRLGKVTYDTVVKNQTRLISFDSGWEILMQGGLSSKTTRITLTNRFGDKLQPMTYPDTQILTNSEKDVVKNLRSAVANALRQSSSPVEEEVNKLITSLRELNGQFQQKLGQLTVDSTGEQFLELKKIAKNMESAVDGIESFSDTDSLGIVKVIQSVFKHNIIALKRGSNGADLRDFFNRYLQQFRMLELIVEQGKLKEIETYYGAGDLIKANALLKDKKEPPPSSPVEEKEISEWKTIFLTHSRLVERTFAVHMLGKLLSGKKGEDVLSQDVVNTLIVRLKEEEDSGVRLGIILALGKIGGEEAAAALRNIMGADEGDFVRRARYFSLGLPKVKDSGPETVQADVASLMETNKTILVLDPRSDREGTIKDLINEGYAAVGISTAGEVLEKIKEGSTKIPLVIVEINAFSGAEGNKDFGEFLKDLRKESPLTKVIVYTHADHIIIKDLRNDFRDIRFLNKRAGSRRLLEGVNEVISAKAESPSASLPMIGEGREARGRDMTDLTPAENVVARAAHALRGSEKHLLTAETRDTDKGLDALSDTLRRFKDVVSRYGSNIEGEITLATKVVVGGMRLYDNYEPPFIVVHLPIKNALENEFLIRIPWKIEKNFTTVGDYVRFIEEQSANSLREAVRDSVQEIAPHVISEEKRIKESQEIRNQAFGGPFYSQVAGEVRLAEDQFRENVKKIFNNAYRTRTGGRLGKLKRFFNPMTAEPEHVLIQRYLSDLGKTESGEIGEAAKIVYKVISSSPVTGKSQGDVSGWVREWAEKTRQEDEKTWDELNRLFEGALAGMIGEDIKAVKTILEGSDHPLETALAHFEEDILRTKERTEWTHLVRGRFMSSPGVLSLLTGAGYFDARRGAAKSLQKDNNTASHGPTSSPAEVAVNLDAGARLQTSLSRDLLSKLWSPSDTRRRHYQAAQDYKIVKTEDDQLKLVDAERWTMTKTPLSDVDDALGILDRIKELDALRKKEGEPQRIIRVLDWGAGEGVALIALKKWLNETAIPNVELIGYSDIYYLGWHNAPEGITFIFDVVENLIERLKGKKIDLIYSRFGMYHYTSEAFDREEVVQHFSDLREVLSSAGEIRSDFFYLLDSEVAASGFTIMPIAGKMGAKMYPIKDKVENIEVASDEPFDKLKGTQEGVPSVVEGIRDTSDAPGGIDLNPALLDLQIKRDGNGVPLPLPMQPIEHMHIEGFLPIIINITPVTNLPMLLGLADAAADTQTTAATPDLKTSQREPVSLLN